MAIPDIVAEVTKLLGPEGPLSVWEGYEHRESQIAMAKEVCLALTHNALALIEAGTGTGKTMAYLLPALLNGKTAVVSTGLKNLQDQIFYKDLAHIRHYLGDAFEDDFKAAILKGRENYVCLRALRTRFLRKSTIRNLKNPDDWRLKLDEWLEETETGEKNEIPEDVSAAIPAEAVLTTPTSNCLGPYCPFKHRCFYNLAKKRAQDADLILVNHDLLLADLKAKLDPEAVGVLPDYAAIIVDEAHLLEDKATKWFGYDLNVDELDHMSKLLADLLTLPEHDLLPKKDELVELLEKLDLSLQCLYENVPFGDLAFLYPDEPESREQNDYIKQILNSIAFLTSTISQYLPDAKPDEGEVDPGTASLPDLERLDVYKAKMALYNENASFIADASDPDFVYQKEHSSHRLVLSAMPLAAGCILGDILKRSHKAVIMTSATLSDDDTFQFFKRRFDFDDVMTLKVDSPFDYPKNTLLYIPRRMPDINYEKDKFRLRFVEQTVDMLRTSKGRALVLFTSYHDLKACSDVLLQALPYQVLTQGKDFTDDKTALLSEFARDRNSVLLATSSFWQGVDVPGESLSVVIIYRLPFTPPDRPINLAREKMYDRKKINYFAQYSLPQAILTLKQGVGRLLRTGQDRGLLALMDNRLITKGYGKKIIRALPPSPLTHDFDEVLAFLEAL
jgi:ATP-dependent DNA helicase DinG